MKKTLKKLVAVLLAIVFVFPTLAYANSQNEDLGQSDEGIIRNFVAEPESIIYSRITYGY